jgi:hypothetical protein
MRGYRAVSSPFSMAPDCLICLGDFPILQELLAMQIGGSRMCWPTDAAHRT